MYLNFLFEKFLEKKSKTAIISYGKKYTYEWLLGRIDYWKNYLLEKDIPEGTVIAIESVYNADSIALFLAVLNSNHIAVPLTTANENKKKEYLEIAEVEYSIKLNNNDIQFVDFSRTAQHSIYETIKSNRHPGLVLFSSGTTGKSKAAVHDISRLISKYKTARHDLRTIAFMFYDHIGGVDTLLYSLSNTSTVYIANDRAPEKICHAIEKYHLQVLRLLLHF